jgi:hypothetical protein
METSHEILTWLDSEISSAMKRIERVIDRVVHFRARSKGQKARRVRERIQRDGRQCDWCGRYDDDKSAHNCAGCGALIPASEFIDVTMVGDKDRRCLRVPA